MNEPRKEKDAIAPQIRSYAPPVRAYEPPKQQPVAQQGDNNGNKK